MVRTSYSIQFQLFHQIKFETNIRGHHVYNNVWTPTNGERLTAKPDNRQETLEIDKHAIGVYQHENDLLVGHIPTELSSLIHYFLEADKGNFLELKVIEKRKREVGLVVPAVFIALTTKKSIAITLHKELKMRKEKLLHFDFKYQQKSEDIRKTPYFNTAVNCESI